MYATVTSGVNSVLQLFTVLIIFVIVLFLTYATTRFIGSYQKTSNANTNFKVIDTYRVSNTKYMQIIQVGKKYLVIAVCKDTIVTLTEVSEEDIKIPEYGNGKDVFSKILEKVKSNKVDINKDKEQDAEKVEEDE